MRIFLIWIFLPFKSISSKSLKVSLFHVAEFYSTSFSFFLDCIAQINVPIADQGFPLPKRNEIDLTPRIHGRFAFS